VLAFMIDNNSGADELADKYQTSFTNVGLHLTQLLSSTLVYRKILVIKVLSRQVGLIYVGLTLRNLCNTLRMKKYCKQLHFCQCNNSFLSRVFDNVNHYALFFFLIH